MKRLHILNNTMFLPAGQENGTNHTSMTQLQENSKKG